MEILDSHSIDKKQFIEYASFGQRFLAGLVDFLVLIIPFGVSMYFTFWDKSLVLVLVANLVATLYKPIMEGIYGATVGKMVVGIHMVDENFEQIDLSKSFIKNGLYLISSTVGIISIYWMFGQEAFLEAEDFMATSIAAQGNPYQIVSTIISIIILISCLMMLTSDTKQTLHDRIANTYCVHK